MSEAIKYFMLGFRNAFGSINPQEFGVRGLGENYKIINAKRIEMLESRGYVRQIDKKPKQTAKR